MVKSLQHIRGWLLFYVLWAIWCIAFSIYASGIALINYENEYSFMLAAGVIVFALVLLFYGLYGFFLFLLLRKRPGIVRKIKAMIAITPVFNAFLPAIFTGILALTNDRLDFGDLIVHAYPPEIAGSLVGATVVAVIWYRYFTVSRRVKEIWPNG